MLASRPWRQGPNLLKRPVDARISSDLQHIEETDTDAKARLERAREVNLVYVSNMPNFVADETAKRYAGDGKSSRWRFMDTIETEVTFNGSRAVRRQIRRNGKAWDRPFDELPGFKWSGGFGTELRPLFDPQCPTAIEYQGRAEARGKQTWVYRFTSPADGCFAEFFDQGSRDNPPRTGQVFLGDSDNRVIRFNEDAEGFPAGFAFAKREEQVWWDDVRIGNDSHLLPVGASFVVFYASGNRYRVDVEYTHHRHFEASTSVTFQ